MDYRAKFNILLALIVVFFNDLVQGGSPKSDIEPVPGLIFPQTIGRVCMIRKSYECKWTYEKSCSCNPVQKPIRLLDVTYFRKKIDKRHQMGKNFDPFEESKDRPRAIQITRG
ncbi:hypothetical protein TKK_0007379 [Trichogramma kaykai]